MIYNNRWTPKKTLHSKAFSGGFDLPKGQTRNGLPYAQPWQVGGYVGHNISLSQFNAIAADGNSKLYRQLAPNGGLYYGSDCSAYVSYCFSHSRMTKRDIASSRDFVRVGKDGQPKVNAIKIGDVFNRTYNGHVILIVGIDDKYIHTLEQTVPDTKYKKTPISRLNTVFYEKGNYRVYRYKYINNVKPADNNYSVQGSSVHLHISHTVKDKKIASFQKWLNNKYGFNIAIDGVYGLETKRAIIKGWQIQMNRTFNCGLSVDGQFGPKCYKATQEYPVNLIKDKKMALTKIVQGLLMFDYKYKVNSVEGIYDNKTLEMIKKFQIRYRLNVTGNVDSDTWFSLFNGGRIYTCNSDSDISTKSNIKKFQKWINTKYSNIIGDKLYIDGQYGPKTKKAIIKVWQYSVNKFYNTNLVVDGIYGQKSFNAAKNVTLKGGEKNRFVVTCEGLLNVAGIYTKYNSKYNLDIKNNVKQFQRKKKIEIDGICGPRTWSKLFNQ